MSSTDTGSTSSDPRSALRRALDHAGHFMPAQGPIDVFIHHNTLHAFQHLPFHEAIAQANALFETQPYLSEARFRQLHREGRISSADLDAALASRDASAAQFGPLASTELDRIALRHDLDPETPAGLRWRLTELDDTQRLRDDVSADARKRFLARSSAWVREQLDRGDAGVAALVGPQSLREVFDVPDVTALREKLARDPEAVAVSALWSQCARDPIEPFFDADEDLFRRQGHDRTLRDLLRAVAREDPAELVNPVMIRYCAAFLDLGVSTWPMPGRENGLYVAWRDIVLSGPAPRLRWTRGLKSTLRDARARGLSAEQVIGEVLEDLGVKPAAYESFLLRVLLQLPGWAGMVHRLETTPGDRPPGMLPPSLVDFVAVRLLYDRLAWRDVARRRLGWNGPLTELPAEIHRFMPRDRSPDAVLHEVPWRMFLLAQHAGLGAGELHAMPRATQVAMMRHLDAFSAVQRRRVWHEGYERHYREEVLLGVARNIARPRDARAVDAPTVQMVFCFDDREEAIRRHVEERDPSVETFGLAGFFGLAMDYQGIDDPRHAPLCPINVTPAHQVREVAADEERVVALARMTARRRWARLRHHLGVGTRSFFRGVVMVPALGLLAILPMAARVLFPRWVGRLQARAMSRIIPTPRTQLDALGEVDVDAFARRFTLDEAADRIQGALENMGLTRRFARLVVVLGHGAASVNNPHRSAYDCGACGGRHGAPNARLFADFANHPGVRERLRARGIDIPDTTVFVGGMHNTTHDGVTLADLERVPASHADDLRRAREVLEHARRMSAHERCRRFASAPDDLTPDEALAHVEARAEDLSQARPELGHVTVAMGVIGPRALTRGLFLDRRCFAISYDPAVDGERGHILERILLAAGPVGAGINLEYFFSCVDNDRYGCGTKLPHNPVGLLGVMDGAASDLRTGLPKQMIEIHEPMRLLLVVNASTETLGAIVGRQPVLQELVGNQWVQVVSLDPTTQTFSRLTLDGWAPWSPPAREVPVVDASPTWYRGKRSFVPVAIVEPRRAA